MNTNPNAPDKFQTANGGWVQRMIAAQRLYEAEQRACKESAACDPDFCACHGHTEWEQVSPTMKRYYARAAQYFMYPDVADQAQPKREHQ